jgi:hypothetical protein
MSISIGFYSKLDLWTANKLHYIIWGNEDIYKSPDSEKA